MRISVAIPNNLTDVSNGRFLGKTDLGDGYTRWDWQSRSSPSVAATAHRQATSISRARSSSTPCAASSTTTSAGGR